VNNLKGLRGRHRCICDNEGNLMGKLNGCLNRYMVNHEMQEVTLS